jgi:hypothetical protein
VNELLERLFGGRHRKSVPISSVPPRSKEKTGAVSAFRFDALPGWKWVLTGVALRLGRQIARKFEALWSLPWLRGCAGELAIVLCHCHEAQVRQGVFARIASTLQGMAAD